MNARSLSNNRVLHESARNINRPRVNVNNLLAQERWGDEGHETSVHDWRSKSARMGVRRLAMYVLGSAELHRKNFGRVRVAAFELIADLRKLNADATKLDEVARPPYNLDDTIVEELVALCQYAKAQGQLLSACPNNVTSQVNLPGDGVLDKLLRCHIRLSVIASRVLPSTLQPSKPVVPRADWRCYVPSSPTAPLRRANSLGTA